MSRVKLWNWQQNDWPEFRFDAARLARLEGDFLHQAGIFSGSFLHIADEGKNLLALELLSEEALKTSEIEGEILNRESVQSSIRRQFGLATDHRKIPPAEQGVAQLMVELHRQFDAPMNEARLLHWQTFFTAIP